MDIRYFDTLESTNNYCKLLDPNTVGEFTVICAHSQTAGIGQQGNVWVSEPNKNLTFSIILKPTFLKATDQYLLTMAIAIAVAENIESHLSVLNSPFSVHIKWPNDIYIGDKKVCGILTTNQISGSRIIQSICGIGLNINQTTFPEWVPNPTSLKLESGQNFQLDTILLTLLKNIEIEYTNLQNNNKEILKQRYLKRLYRMGKESDFIYQEQIIRATITGVNHFGHLQLTTSNREHLSCGMKEIKFII